MDLYQAIRLRAMRSVMRPDREFLIRKVLRWYSKTFFTPIAEVEEIPLEDVFQAYYEEMYEDMSEEDLEAERQELLITPEQRYDQIILEEANDAEMFEMGRMIAAEEAAKAKSTAKAKIVNQIVNLQHQQPGPIAPVEMSETDLPTAPRELPPGITMTFVDEDEFEAALDGFGAMSQPKKP